MTGSGQSLRERIDATRKRFDDICRDMEVSPVGHAASAHVAVGRELPLRKSVWADAIEIAAVRDRRRAQSLDISVRALALEVGCSHGRAGELLKMHDELSGRVALFLGWGDVTEGERLLSRLSYRDLRSILTIPATSVMRRAERLRQLVQRERMSTSR